MNGSGLGAKDKRLLYQFIINQLNEDGYLNAARLVSEVTSIPSTQQPPASVMGPPPTKNRLWNLIQTGLQKEREELNPNGVEPAAAQSTANTNDDFMEEPIFIIRTNLPGIDLDVNEPGRRMDIPVYNTKFITTHKNACRVAKFSPDGRLVATGSTDTSIKLLDVGKMKSYNQNKSEHGEDFAPAKPVIRTFYDHTEPINDLDFHPTAHVLASCARDNTVKFYDFSQATMKRGFRYIQESNNVRTINFHPSGDYLLVGTEQPTIRLYDIATSQAYISDRPKDQHTGPINQLRYSVHGNIYVSCSKDGAIKVWDGVTNRVITNILKAHSGSDISRNQKYILSSGKDSIFKIWELSTGRQLLMKNGPSTKNRLQVTWNWNEEMILTSEETTNTANVWDTRSGELVQKLSGHTNVVKWIASSSVEPAVVTCSADHRARFWLDER